VPFVFSFQPHAAELSTNFESGFGGFSNVGEFSFLRRSGTTPSGGTGPSSGANGTTYYAYLETSGGSAYAAGDQGILQINDVEAKSLSFYYHKYGADMGRLEVEVYFNDVWHLLTFSSGQTHTSTTAAWSKVTLNLSSYPGKVDIRFVGKAKGGYRGDMAIDEITIDEQPNTLINFETNFGGMVNTGSYNLSRDSGGTSSGGTGPSSGANGTNYYTYFETSGGAANAAGNTGMLEYNGVDADVMRFHYHMYGANIGTLAIDKYMVNGWERAWEKTGQQHTSSTDEWTQVYVDVKGATKLRFVTTAIGGYAGDIAIDEIEFEPADYYNHSPNFNTGLRWTNTGTYDWSLQSGATSSGGTGPSSGQGYNPYSVSTYAYVETSVGSAYAAGNTALLESPYYEKGNLVWFYYSMIGADIGALYLEGKNSAGNWAIIWAKNGPQTPNAGTDWTKAEVDISNYNQIRFKMVAAGGYRGDIAVDSVRMLFDGNDEGFEYEDDPDSYQAGDGVEYSFCARDNDGIASTSYRLAGTTQWIGSSGANDCHTVNLGELPTGGYTIETKYVDDLGNVYFSSDYFYAVRLGGSNAPTPSLENPVPPSLAAVPDLSTAEESVGSLTGQTQVSNGGEAKWHTALQLPNGIGNFTPKVSVSYGSQSGNGIMGVGWSVAAYDTISRCRRFFEEDSEYRPVEFNNDDSLCLNGQRLKLVSGSNLINGAEYRLTMDATTKVKYSSNTTGGYFTVFNPNGEQKVFGNSQDSITSKGTTVYSWRLAEKRDSFNNLINYFYIATLGHQVRLSEINYSGNQVLFHYSTRPDVVKHFYHGESVIKDQRLDWIEIKNHYGVPINSYHIGYRASRMSGRMLVTSVSRCDGNQSGICLSPTEFDYTDDVPVGFLPAEVIPLEDLVTTQSDFDGCESVVQGSQLSHNRFTYCTSKYINLIDTDGDGKKELLVSNGLGDNYHYRVIEIEDNGYTSLSNAQGELFQHYTSVGHNIWAVWYSGSPLVIDTDGDGIDEIRYLDSSGSDGDYWKWADFDGDGLVQFVFTGSDSYCFDCDDDSNTISTYKYSIADITDLDGDGLVDRIIRRQLWERILDEPPAVEEYAGETLYFAEFNTTAGPGSPIQFDSKLIESPYSNTWSNSVTHMSEDYSAASADINGDGYIDSERHGCLDGEVFRSCYEFGRFGLWTADVNGDGIADPIELENGVPTYSLNYWDTSRTSTSKGREASITQRVLHADFDGDGQPTLVVFDFNTQSILLYRDANTSNVRGDLLSSVKDGQDVETELTYEALFNSDRYTPYDNAELLNWNTTPVYDAKGFMHVVTDYEQTSAFNVNEAPLTTTTRMYYEGLRQQAGGRGSLGFAKTIRENITTGIRTVTTYRQQYPFTGQVSEVEKQFKNSNGNFISSSLYEVLAWESQTFYSDEVRFVQPKITRRTAYDYQQSASGTISTASPAVTNVTTETKTWTNYLNSYPLPERVNVLHDDRVDVGQSQENTTVYEYNDENLSKWHISRPTRIEVTSSRSRSDGSTDTKTMETNVHYDASSGRIDFNEKGNKNEPNKYLKTDYVLDTFGNIVTAAKCSAHYEVNCATRSVPNDLDDNNLQVYRKAVNVYDSEGRYITETRNALFTELSILSRNSLGLPTSMRDANGVVEDVFYDTFGREYFSRANTGNYVRTKRVQNNEFVELVTSSPTAPTTKTLVDGLGRTLRTSTQIIDGRFTNVNNEYNGLAQLISTSLPYFDSTTPDGYKYFDYNSAGDLWRTTAADGSETVLSGSTSSRTKTVVSQYVSSVGAAIGSGDLTQITRIDNNGFGELLATIDGNNKTTSYQFDALGSLSNARNVDDSEIVVSNDAHGRKVGLDDPDKGNITYGYNALDEAISRTAPGGATQNTLYDAVGRKLHTEYSEGGSLFLSTFEYVGPQLMAESSSEGLSVNYGYDNIGRIQSKTSIIDAQIYQESYTYDEFGRVFQVFDASGNYRGIQYGYQNGYQSEIRESSDSSRVYFKVQEMDHRFNITQWALGNGATGYATFDALNGVTTSISYSNGQNTSHQQQFEFDSLGNLRARQDLLANQNETFSYDNLNRVTNGTLNGNTELSLTYFDNGNIQTKSDVASGAIYRYGEDHTECGEKPGPHALTSIGNRYRYCYDSRGNQLEARENSTLTRRVEFTSYDKPSLIWSLNGESEFYYGADLSRFKRVDRINGEVKTTKFVGAVEIVTENSSTRYKRYVGSQTIVEVNQAGQSTESYFYLDHIGSIVVIADEFGIVKEKLSYDAFGRRRDGLTLERLDSLIEDSSVANALDITQKGFTGHEHVDHAEVVHMGGRIYDPTVGRFMQADPIVQAPDNGQSLNRYSYVFNNPLSFTDPTGYIAEPVTCAQSDWRGGCPTSGDGGGDEIESNAQDSNNTTIVENNSTDGRQTSSGAFAEQGGTSGGGEGSNSAINDGGTFMESNLPGATARYTDITTDDEGIVTNTTIACGTSCKKESRDILRGRYLANIDLSMTLMRMNMKSAQRQATAATGIAIAVPLLFAEGVSAFLLASSEVKLAVFMAIGLNKNVAIKNADELGHVFQHRLILRRDKAVLPGSKARLKADSNGSKLRVPVDGRLLEEAL
jgi:RHS repeat-associated protein